MCNVLWTLYPPKLKINQAYTFKMLNKYEQTWRKSNNFECKMPLWTRSTDAHASAEACASEELNLIFGVSRYFYSVDKAPRRGIPADLM
jgi:hypothetical protein